MKTEQTDRRVRRTRHLLTDALLKQGTLIRPLRGAIQTQGAYYVVVAEREKREEVRLFEAWVLDQFRASPPALRQPARPPGRAAARGRTTGEIGPSP